MTTTYGQSVVWTDFGGSSKQTLTVSGCKTLGDAKWKAFHAARQTGWRPPRWWQWWRRFDTRLPPDISIKALDTFTED